MTNKPLSEEEYYLMGQWQYHLSMLNKHSDSESERLYHLRRSKEICREVTKSPNYGFIKAKTVMLGYASMGLIGEWESV